MPYLGQAAMAQRDCPKDIKTTPVKTPSGEGAGHLHLDARLRPLSRKQHPNVPARSGRSRSAVDTTVAGVVANDGLDYAIRASLIRQLLSDIQIVCEAAPQDDLRFLCVALRIWRRLRRRRTSVAAVLPSFVVTLSKLSCLFRVPGDCGVVVKRYLASLSQRPAVDGCGQMQSTVRPG